MPEQAKALTAGTRVVLRTLGGTVRGTLMVNWLAGQPMTICDVDRPERLRQPAPGPQQSVWGREILGVEVAGRG